jgi:L-ascorbate metabolism protein UlaG (beta-lactamase superfamily)
MKIKWWGHASFLITADDGRKILTDPYNEEVGYKRITDEVDIVTVSHEHFDHNAVHLLPGSAKVIRTLEGYENELLKIRGIASYHDEKRGAERGNNRIYLIELENKRICHLGDLGHTLDDEYYNIIKGIDILMIPVGGYYTIDARVAFEIIERVNPSIVLPMHYKTEVINFPISGIEGFKSYFKPSEIAELNEAELDTKKLPEDKRLFILEYVK